MPDTPDLGLDYRYEPRQDETRPLTLLVLAEGTADALLATAAIIAPGAGLLAPTLPAVDDPHELAAALADFVVAAVDAFGLDGEEVWGLGFGEGAAALTGLAVDHPAVLVGMVVLSGRVLFPSPGGRRLDGVRVFCAHGTDDTAVSEADFSDLVELYVTAGAEAELHWYDGCGHEIVEAETTDAARWLARWTEAPRAPAQPQVDP